MTAFDTDILSDHFRGVQSIVARVDAVPASEQFVPIVVAEEQLRGRLDAIRKSQATPRWLTLEQAYEELEKTLADLSRFQVLPYTSTADALFKTWRAMKIRIGTQDLRIAAIAFAHNAKLVTRNARNFSQVPGLTLEMWQ